jgi:hypothetical protein
MFCGFWVVKGGGQQTFKYGLRRPKRMVFRLAGSVNGKAKKNKGNSIDKEGALLESSFQDLDARVDVTKEPEEVVDHCRDYIRELIELVILSGGDGTVQNFLTEHFKQMYRHFGRGMTPIHFARVLNSMALDPASGLILPAIYHRRRGTVNVYADTLGMKGNLDTITRNLLMANQLYENKGLAAFRRVYVPIMIRYDANNPNDLDSIQLMTLFADGLTYNIFKEYYAPKEKGRTPSMLTALKVVARASASVTLDKLLPRDSPLGGLYNTRYRDRILEELEGEVKIDGTTVIEKGEKRNATAIGTMGVNLYGIHPFCVMPSCPKEFKAYFAPGMPATPDALDARQYQFQVLVGNPDLVDIVKSIPRFYQGRPPCITRAIETVAKRVEVDQVFTEEQKDQAGCIVDGSRKDSKERFVVEIAYLQPFALLDRRPMA